MIQTGGKSKRRAVVAGATLVVACLAAIPNCRASQSAASIADAAEQNNTAEIESLLAKQADPNAVQTDGMTALHWAAYHDNRDAVLLLLKAGAKAAVANRYNVTPLSLACTNGNDAIVKALLQSGADAHAKLDGGQTVLMTAARTGNVSIVRQLLDKEIDVNAKDWKGQTALMWAAAEGHANVIQLLLTANADQNISLKSGFAPLFFAAREGKTQAALTLINAGADVNSTMKPVRPNGKSARTNTTALMLAVENGHFQLAIELVKAGADPNDQRSGFTVLHAITWVRKPNRGDGADGEPPPQGSGLMTSLQFVRKAVASGANVNARLKRGKSGRGRLNQTAATPFLMAADTADLPLMKLLMELHAVPSIPNADGTTALLPAAGIGTMAPGEEAGTEEEAIRVVDYLLKHGFSINAVDDNGETSVHGAVYASWPDMVQHLVNRGADIKTWHKKNKYGWTPLRIAQGHRPGNFKPAAATIAAVEKVMMENGLTPTEAEPFKGGNEYSKKKRSAAPKTK